jgi:hypothetical protein
LLKRIIDYIDDSLYGMYPELTKHMKDKKWD